MFIIWYKDENFNDVEWLEDAKVIEVADMVTGQANQYDPDDFTDLLPLRLEPIICAKLETYGFKGNASKH